MPTAATATPKSALTAANNTLQTKDSKALTLVQSRDAWHSPTRVWYHKVMKPQIYTMSFARIYPLYVAKAERKGRQHTEVDEIIRWLTGYSQDELEKQLENQTDLETFFANAPKLNPSRSLIKGMICGVRVEDIEEPTMQEIRYLDKLIDELANGKAMEKILRR